MSKTGGGPDGALVPVSDSASGQSDLSAELGPRRLTAVEFQGLADVPPETEWFANIDSVQTRHHRLAQGPRGARARRHDRAAQAGCPVLLV